MKRFFVVLFLLLSVTTFADPIQVDALLSGLRDPLTDNPLAGGKVYTYNSGFSGNKDCWLDANKTQVAPNPFILDAYGRGILFAEGVYGFTIKDANDNVVLQIDNIEYNTYRTLAQKTSDPFGPILSQTQLEVSDLRATLGQDLDANSFRIINLASPSVSADAVPKAYVDTRVGVAVASAVNQITAQFTTAAQYNWPAYQTTFNLPTASGSITYSVGILSPQLVGPASESYLVWLPGSLDYVTSASSSVSLDVRVYLLASAPWLAGSSQLLGMTHISQSATHATLNWAQYSGTRNFHLQGPLLVPSQSAGNYADVEFLMKVDVLHGAGNLLSLSLTTYGNPINWIPLGGVD